MILSVQQIKYELLAYMKEFGGDFSEWFVGIASDARATLGDLHRLDLERDLWIYKQALTFQAARTVQDYFMAKLGTDGQGNSLPDDDFDCLYAFRKTARTWPAIAGSAPEFLADGARLGSLLS